MSNPVILIRGTEELGARLFETGINEPEFDRVMQAFVNSKPASKQDILTIINKLPKFMEGRYMDIVDDLKKLVVDQRISTPAAPVSDSGEEQVPPPGLEALKILFDTTSEPIIPRISIKSAVIQIAFPDPTILHRVQSFIEKVDSSYKVVGTVGGVLEVSCAVVAGLDTTARKLIEAVNKAYQLSMAVDKLSSVYNFIGIEAPVIEHKAPEQPQGRLVDEEGIEIVQSGFVPVEKVGDLR